MRPSYRSPLTAMLRRAHAACRDAAQTGAPIGEVTAMHAERLRSPGRRRVLTGALAAAAMMTLPTRSLAIGKPRVVIVGGGIAGLACAYRLWNQHHIQSTIYEWGNHAGGRIHTLRNYFAHGQVSEQHAEDISSEHSQTLRLASKFGLTLENTWADPKRLQDAQFFSGALYSQADLNNDWYAFGWKLFNNAARDAWPTNYRKHTKLGQRWDQMSVDEWITHHVPGGLSSRFGKTCRAAVLSEYGGPPENQSALNLVYLLGYNASAPSGYQSPLTPLLAGTDEKWHIVGGNDLLIDALVSRLPAGTVNFGHRLTALGENPDGSFTCTFDHGGSTVEAAADHVVLALPFTTLRNVDLSHVTISPLKQAAIANLQYGNNAKIQIQVAGRPWGRAGFSGSVLTDAPLDGGWDASSFQDHGKRGPAEIFVGYPGGNEGLALASKYALTFGNEQGPALASMVSDTLDQLEPMFPGITAAWERGPKRAWFNDGNINERLLGAYSQYNVGQYTGFAGIEGKREGNIHFAGEHTSFAFQGFVEGAMRSGLQAANEIAGVDEAAIWETLSHAPR